MNLKQQYRADHKTAIQNWNLEEVSDAQNITFELPGILKLVSQDSKTECFDLLRAVVNLFINARLQRQGVVNHWSRERKLVINYLRKENWEWQIELLDTAKAYENFENRPSHNALLEISGSVVRFESGIKVIQRTL